MAEIASPMQEEVNVLSRQLREKDSVIEQLEQLLRSKEREENDL